MGLEGLEEKWCTLLRVVLDRNTSLVTPVTSWTEDLSLLLPMQLPGIGYGYP
jgi:hypothetical protein